MDFNVLLYVYPFLCGAFEESTDIFWGSLFLGRTSVSWCLERCGTLNMIFLTTLPWKHVFFCSEEKSVQQNKHPFDKPNQNKARRCQQFDWVGLGWHRFCCHIHLLRLGKFSPAFWPKDVNNTQKTTWKPAEFYGHPEWYIKNKLHQAGP